MKYTFKLYPVDYFLLKRSLEDAIYKNLCDSEYGVVAEIACLLDNLQQERREEHKKETQHEVTTTATADEPTGAGTHAEVP